MKNCLFCGREIIPSLSLSFLFSFQRLAEPQICDSCLKLFHRIDSNHSCPGCARVQNDATLCADCRAWQRKYPHLVLKHHALFQYNDIAQEYLKAYKLQGDIVLAEVFKKELRAQLKPCEKNSVIIPLPISSASFAVRGFNQVTLLLERAGISYQNCFAHQGKGEKQAQKSRSERLRTPQCFAREEEIMITPKTEKIILVDDIYTTGRTLMHAKKLVAENKPVGERKPLTVESFTLFR